MKINSKNGISLLVLVITMIVIVILAAAVIISINNSGVFDKSKKARFMSDFTSVQDGVNVYSSGKYNESTGKFELPIKGYLTQADKVYIFENIPTLSIKIQELSGSIDSANLAWINSEDIGANLSKDKEEKGYIMDVTTGQIYDYNGDVFENKRWHTLDDGIVVGDNVSNGHIKLTLFYPDGSTERQWRLGNPGELRLDPSLQWQDYISPIYIPIYRTQDVWIKYVLNGQDVTIPPAGTLLVDIIPDETKEIVKQVNVSIDYDKDAKTKEYRVGNSGWLPYTAPFVVTENSIVAARSTKTDEVKDSNGNVILTRDIYGTDKIYIGNIGIDESELIAPTIERLYPIDGTEKARVKVTYPEGADQKIYKVNYGIEQNYTEEISIKEWDTTILAYYYDSTGKRSKGAIILINDPALAVIEQPEEYKPIDTNDLTDPNNPYNPNNIDNPNNPNNPYSMNNPNNIYSPLNVNNPYNSSNPNSPYNPSSSNYPTNLNSLYNINNPNSPYNPYNPKNMFNPNNPSSPYSPDYQPEVEDLKLAVSITANPDPLIDSTKVGTVAVSIDYDSRSTEKTYKINDGEIKNYTGSFQITENSTIYAYAKGANNASGSAIKLIDNLLSGISKPVITPNPSEVTLSAKVKIGIQYDKNAVIKKYSIDNGDLKNYDGEFEISKNGTVIYAYNENANGESAESTYTVINVDSEQTTQVEEAPLERTAVLDKEKYYIMKLSYPENSIVKEYKFTENGTWTPYNQDGIMLIRSQYKDEVLANVQTNGVLRIKDDSGNSVDFKGEWYVINTTVEDLIESLFMRWSLTGIPGPQIVENTTMPVKEATITLICPEGYKTREYKVVKEGEPIPNIWQTYTAPFKVYENNLTIYARYENAYSSKSEETSYKVTNIDEIPPVISLEADLNTVENQKSIHVTVTDNVEVSIVKWAAGLQGESYFVNGGTEILNEDTVTITGNGTYTFYAEDMVGNKQTYTLTVTNLDNIKPIATWGTPSKTTIENTESVTIPLTFTETQSGINNSTVNLTNVTIQKTGITAATVSLSGSGNNWIATVNGISGAGSFTLTATTGITDNANNTLNANVVSTSINVTVYVGFENATFTTAGAGGRYGPTQAQLNSAYVGTPLAGAVTSSNGIQLWTVPATGTYYIECYGSQGGYTYGKCTGGLGAIMKGNFNLTQGKVLNIVVGQKGNSNGGGGGTFVVDGDINTVGTPLIIAGGGGSGGGYEWSSSSYVWGNGKNAVTTINATSGNGGAAGGASGNPGQAGSSYGSNGLNGSGGGGSGWNGDATGGFSGTSYNALKRGGIGGSGGGDTGGFGGGGSGWIAGGGGGGYSGGGGGNWSSGIGGGGGGSYNVGTSQSNSVGNVGNGRVVITKIN